MLAFSRYWFFAMLGISFFEALKETKSSKRDRWCYQFIAACCLTQTHIHCENYLKYVAINNKRWQHTFFPSIHPSIALMAGVRCFLTLKLENVTRNGLTKDTPFKVCTAVITQKSQNQTETGHEFRWHSKHFHCTKNPLEIILNCRYGISIRMMYSMHSMMVRNAGNELVLLYSRSQQSKYWIKPNWNVSRCKCDFHVFEWMESHLNGPSS